MLGIRSKDHYFITNSQKVHIIKFYFLKGSVPLHLLIGCHKVLHKRGVFFRATAPVVWKGMMLLPTNWQKAPETCLGKRKRELEQESKLDGNLSSSYFKTGFNVETCLIFHVSLTENLKSCQDTDPLEKSNNFDFKVFMGLRHERVTNGFNLWRLKQFCLPMFLR